ncbi:MAG: LLM class flavin-dependent oxidoreductase [Pseudomonadota bacterium]|nr:LLM class flavin-dependent oxidoreductase [Pseudomonadota bacterium]
MARIADRMEFEGLVPVARWKGCGSDTNMYRQKIRGIYTCAAGLGALTKNRCVLATSHVPTMRPVLAATQSTTIDHITNGRFALNIVCGCFRNEMELFGGSLMEHDKTCDYGAELLDVMIKRWTIDGEHFNVRGRFEIT